MSEDNGDSGLADFINASAKLRDKLTEIIDQSEAEDKEEVNVPLDDEETELLLSALAVSDLGTESHLQSSLIMLRKIGDEIKGVFESVDEEFEGINQEETEIPVKDLAINYEASDEIILYYSLASTLIEEQSVELLKLNLIDNEFRQSNKTDRLLERRLNQEEREQLLLRTGIIDEGLAGELQRIRETRNEIVHDLSERQSVGAKHIEKSDITRCSQAIDKLLAETGRDGIKNEDDGEDSNT